jgi:mRNA interferase MazF
MVTLSQGEIWWADLGEPRGSKPAFRRPVLVIQGDGLNRSRIATVVCVAMTSNLKWGSAPGNVLLSGAATGLPQESVANVSQVVTLDKSALSERMGKLSKAKLELVLSGVDVVLGR